MGVMTEADYVKNNSNTKLSLLLLTFDASLNRKKREAGFYTTRYGRSDPMLSPVMRMRDSQTRFFPEPVALDQESKHNKPLKYITLFNQSPEQGEEEIQPKVFCEFSVRKKVYFCKPSSESPWKKIDDTLMMSLT